MRVRCHESQNVASSAVSEQIFRFEGSRRCFWELNTDLEATVEVLGSIDRLDGVVGLVN